MAPGVQHPDHRHLGTTGLQPGLTTASFNGTSSATPFVAAAAGLVLSVRPTLSEAEVRKILTSTADKIETATSDWNQYRGFGRLNVFSALRAARKGDA